MGEADTLRDREEQARYYIARLGGPDDDDAYHSLIEYGHGVIPYLLGAYAVGVGEREKSRLPVPSIWRRELDGVVRAADRAVLPELERLRMRFHGQDRADWIAEAMTQIAHGVWS